MSAQSITIVAIAWFVAWPSLAIGQSPQGVRGVPVDTQRPSKAWPRLVETGRTEAELIAVLESKPSDLQPYLELAYIYDRTGRTDDAAKVLRRALGVHPQTGAVYAAMLIVYGGLGDTKHRDKIAEISEEWVKAEPTNPQPLFALGNVHLSRAREARDRPTDALIHLDRAKQVIDDAVRLGPSEISVLALRMAIAKQRLALTEDPAEREQLQREIAKGTWASSQMTWADGSASGVKAVSASQITNAVRVGGNVKVPTKIKDVKPVYPADALQSRVQGVVIFEVVIDEAGKVAEARVLRSIPMLDQAAQEAVRQWEFTPTLLNDSPVPVILTVTVQFTLPPQ